MELDFFDKPQNLRERRTFYQYFYNTNSQVSNFIDLKSSLIVNLGDLIPLGEQIKGKWEKYALNFFTEMYRRLNIWETLNYIAREYLIFGNCAFFAEEYDCKGKSKSNAFDNNELNLGWSNLFILSLNQIKVAKVPLGNEEIIQHVPDPLTKSTLKNKSPFKLSSNIPLNKDPYKGSFIKLFAKRTSPYEPLGISVLERHFNDLCEKKNISIEIPEAHMDLFKSQLKTFVEECLFVPVAFKKGLGFYPSINIKDR
jgi:hypothetical protein